MLLRIGFAVLALSYLMPGHFLPWTAFQPQWVSALALLALGAAAVSLRGAAARRTPLPLPGPALLALALTPLPWLQYAFGQLPFLSDALLPGLYLLAFGMSVVVGSALYSRLGERASEWLLDALLMAGAVSVGIALSQWLRIGTTPLIDDLRPGDRPGANLAQANHLATLLSLSVIALLQVYQARRLSSPVCGLLLVWLGLGLVMTQSRTGWLSMIIVAVVLLSLRRRLNLRASASAVGVAVGTFAAAILTWPAVNEWLLLDTANLADRLSVGTRRLHWATLWDAAWRQPWFGYGWQQVTLAQQAAVLDHAPSHEMVQNSHNVVLDLLIWVGTPIGGTLAAVGTWWTWWRQARAINDAHRLWLWCAVLAIGVHALLEYPLDHAYFLLPLGLLVGLLEQSLPSAPLKSSRTLPRPVFVALLAAMTCMLFWIGQEYMRVEQAGRDVRLLLAGVGLDVVPSVPPPDVVLLDGPREYHRFMITPARAGMMNADLDWMRAVSQRNAYPPAMLRFALAAGLNGRPEEAALTMRRLCAMHPPRRCSEAREAWRSAQESFPGIAAIPGP